MATAIITEGDRVRVGQYQYGTVVRTLHYTKTAEVDYVINFDNEEYDAVYPSEMVYPAVDMRKRNHGIDNSVEAITARAIRNCSIRELRNHRQHLVNLDYAYGRFEPATSRYASLMVAVDIELGDRALANLNYLAAKGYFK